MLLIDVLLRYPAVAVRLVLAALRIRDGGGRVQALLGAGLTVSLAAMLIGTAPAIRQPPFPALVAVRLIDMPNMLFLWLFGPIWMLLGTIVITIILSHLDQQP